MSSQFNFLFLVSPSRMVPRDEKNNDEDFDDVFKNSKNEIRPGSVVDASNEVKTGVIWVAL